MTDHPSLQLKGDVSIVIGGEAGQGIQSMEYILTHILKRAGYHVFGTQEYMSRIRGGSNSTEIRVSSTHVAAYVDRIDLLIPLDKDALPHLASRISTQTVILGEREKLATSHPLIDIPFSKIAAGLGNALYANTVAIGVLLALLKCAPEMLDEYLREFFAGKAQAVIDKNIEAGRKGYAIGLTLSGPGRIDIQITPHPELRDGLFISGDAAVALGAIAGGCRFIAAYPMSPSTAVFTFLAQHGAAFEIAVEQAEDEIAAMNMGIGAWYAGARALVSTAGGGFSLMTEGLSLAGMLESPLVVHIAQRPGPATGLPTRTEQGDLNLALYAGHGEFPRAILTPGTLAEAFYLTHRAFNLADRYQVPVFLLTDQYLIESHYGTPAFDLSGLRVEHQFVRTEADYRRYQVTDSGLSPRGIPGYGSGLVVLDSDEHDEEGHITESPDVRKTMVDKRLRKLQALASEVLAPELTGSDSYKTLVVAWGSNYHVVAEALRVLGRDDIAFLHFKQVYPLPQETENYLKRAGRVISVENNATGQFAQLIKLQTGIDIEHKVLKYTGWPFSVEEMVAQLGQLAL